MRRLIVITCLLSFAVLAFAGCDPDETDSQNGNTPVATSGTQDAPTADGNVSPSPTALVAIQTLETNVEFGREPISEPAKSTTVVPIILADAGTPGVYDRMTFQFDGDLPAYEINYVPGPAQDCASGQDSQVTGEAFLQIRLSPAVAHDDQGAQTVASTDMQLGLPVLSQAKQTCDFEGVVVWTLGLTAEVDYRVNTYVDRILVIDLKHP